MKSLTCKDGVRFEWAIVCAVIAAAAVSSSSAGADEPATIKLWAHGAPGDPPTKPDDEPVLLVSTPAMANGTAVVVLPGGGYAHLAMDHEGSQIADWLNSMGVTAFVLKYRMSATGHRHPVPMMDGQRAIRYVRSHAKDWKIDPAKIGIMGFSAGGHLASTLSTHFDAGKAGDSDLVEQVSSRPDFAILCYPVISFTEKFAHAGSRKNLLGEAPDADLVKNLSNETQVTKDTPPTFIFQTTEDSVVPAENCIAYYLALHKAGVPAEMHVFQSGKHGVGLAKEIPGTKLWPDLCREWLKARGLVQPNAQN